MGISKLTFFEIHLHDASFGPTFGAEGTADADDEVAVEPSEGGDRSPGLSVWPLLVVAGVVGVALVARKLLYDREETEIPVED